MPFIRMLHSSGSLVALVILTSEVIVLHHLHMFLENLQCVVELPIVYLHCYWAVWCLLCRVQGLHLPAASNWPTTLYDMNANIT